MKANDHGKRCLLIASTTFYSYSRYVQEALAELGYIVTRSNQEYPVSMIGNIMGKLHIPLLLFLTELKITKSFIYDKTYDLVLILNGRGISVSLLKKLQQISPRIVGYHYDSFRFDNTPLKWFKYVSKYCTFDYKDAAVYNLPIVELFSSFPESTKPKTCRYEISAILKNHSNRLKLVSKVLSRISTEKKFIYIYERNILTFLKNFIKYPFLYFQFRRHIRFEPLSYEDYKEVLLNSNFTIDFAHPKQTGITMRCFEALSAQTKIITDNPYVLRNSNFNETNTIILNDSTDSCKFKARYDGLSNQIPLKYHRTIVDFINDLIS